MDLEALAHAGQQVQQALDGHAAAAGGVGATSHIFPPAHTNLASS